MRKETKEESAPVSVPLAELLSALSQEFASAVADHHANLSYWKQHYENNPILKDYRPGGLRVISCSVTLPIALSDVTTKKQDVEVTATQIADTIDREVPLQQRYQIASRVHGELAKQDKAVFSNANLVEDIRRIVLKQIPDLKERLNLEPIAEVQRALSSGPAAKREVTCLFRSEDLKELPPELIVSLQLELMAE